MKNNKFKIFILTLLVAFNTFMFAGCEYGTPDKLDIAGMSVGTRIVTGLLVAVLGLVTVFLVLFFLILLIHVLKYLVQLPTLIKKKKSASASVDAQPEEFAEVSSVDDEEIIAVITAAVAVYMEADAQTKVSSGVNNLGFRVRSIKEINNH